MVRPSIRATLTGLAGAGLTVSVVLAAGLVAFTTWLHAVVTTQGVAVESVRAAEEIEVQLLEAQRQAVLRAHFDVDDEAAVLRDEAWSAVHHWLGVAERHVTSAAEQEALDELTGHIRRIEERWREVRDEGSDEGRAATEAEVVDVQEAVTRAIEAGDRLIELNLADARAAQHDAARLDTVANLVASGLVSAVIGIVLVGVWSMRVQLALPLQQVRRAITRFGAGDARSRAPTDGPAEIVEIARTFNETADALERGRRDQLAFVASVAHDLKNPLQALRLAATVAERGGAEAQARSRRLVLRQIEHLARMVDDLLDESRIEAGELDLRLDDADLVSIGEQVVEMFRATAARHELVVASDGPARARVDEARMAQVLTNLVSNAIKYSPGGGRVTVRVAEGDGGIRLTVEDQGIGIPPEEQGALFRPFRRSAGGREVAGGVGLGLSTARRIVDAHGGTLTLHSRPGEGSIFTVSLPRRVDGSPTNTGGI